MHEREEAQQNSGRDRTCRVGRCYGVPSNGPLSGGLSRNKHRRILVIDQSESSIQESRVLNQYNARTRGTQAQPLNNTLSAAKLVHFTNILL